MHIAINVVKLIFSIPTTKSIAFVVVAIVLVVAVIVVVVAFVVIVIISIAIVGFVLMLLCYAMLLCYITKYKPMFVTSVEILAWVLLSLFSPSLQFAGKNCY